MTAIVVCDPSIQFTLPGQSQSSFAANGRILWTLAFFVFSFILVFGGLVIGRRFNVDENVFIASGALVARRHLLPYRDFQYNHMPTLVLIYSLLFRLSDHLLLIARTFSGICAAATAAAIFHFAYGAFEFLGGRKRLLFALGIGAVFLVDPMFSRTAGVAWNHDFPAMCSVFAFLAMSRGLRNGANAWFIGLAGALVGLAVTTRLTFAPELLPFVLFVIFCPQLSLRRRGRLLAAFTLGCIIACLPTIWIWAQSPRNAYFGTFQYPALNSRFHIEHDDAEHQRFSVLSRVWFFLSRNYLPGNGVVNAAYVIFTVAAYRFWPMSAMRKLEMTILILLAMSQAAAGLVPAPPFLQYFYAATPFMVLALVIALAARTNLAEDYRLHRLLAGGVVVCILCSIPDYKNIRSLPFVDRWIPMQIHQGGLDLARATGPGRVITLEPVIPLEGGLDIDEKLACGRFVMRVGDYLTPELRDRYKMYCTADIGRIFRINHFCPYLRTETDDGVGLEIQFVTKATRRGYRGVDLGHDRILYLPPNK